MFIGVGCAVTLNHFSRSKVKVVSEHSFTKFVKQPTHLQGALLDHVWGNELITEVNLTCIATPYSDHEQVFFDFHH